MLRKYNMKKKDRYAIIIFSALTILMLLFFALTFRIVRDNLPPTPISANKIIGYSQYFGYPLFLDTAIFLILILLPIIFFVALRLVEKGNKHK